MRVLIVKFFILWLLAAAAQLCALGQSSGGKCHVLLLDVSGSMKDRYNGDLKSWLIEPLLASNGFNPNDRVLVRWFDKRGNTNFTADDQQRWDFRKWEAKDVLDKVPVSAPGLQTDLLEAIKLAYADIENLQIQGDVLIWMLTDNQQDAGGKEDPTEFYKYIISEEKFRAAYLFPLVKEKDGQEPERAMVLYLMHYSQKPSSFKLDSIAESASKKIHNQPVTWFPLETGISINPSNIVVNDEPAMIVDNKLKLPVVAEGVTPDFTIHFPFTSRLHARKLEGSLIKNQKASLDSLPSTLETQGDASSWHVDISPKTLTIEPYKNSEVIYTTTIGGNDLTLHPASFWDALWNPLSEPVDIKFQYTLEDEKPVIDSQELSQVRDLDKIAAHLRPSQKNIRPGQVLMSFQVQYNTLWRRVLVGLLVVFALALAGGAMFALASKSHYALSSPFGEQVLPLPLMGRSYITINGDRAAVIRKRFGKMSIAPLGTYLLSGAVTPQVLEENAENNFTLDNQMDARHYAYSLRRLVRQKNVPIKDDDSWNL